MALVQYDAVLQGYLEVEVDQNTLLNGENNIVTFDSTANFANVGGNLYQARQVVEDLSAWQSVTAGTLSTANSYTADKKILPIIRPLQINKLGDAEAMRDGAEGLLQNAAEIFARNYASNIEKLIFQNILPACLTGCVSGSHLNNQSSSAFDFNYVMDSIYNIGSPSQYRYVFIHPAVAKAAQLYTKLDTPTLSITDPVRIGKSINMIGQKNGLLIYSTTLCPKAGNVYTTYVLGEGAIDGYIQSGFNTETWYDPRYEGGAWMSKYRASLALAPEGLSYKGTTTTDVNGFPASDLATPANWQRMTNARDNQILFTGVLSLV